jgi:hypothetical protein
MSDGVFEFCYVFIASLCRLPVAGGDAGRRNVLLALSFSVFNSIGVAV